MIRPVALFAFLLFFSCEENKVLPTAQEVIDKSIEVCGGDLYISSDISFDFRGTKYSSEVHGKKKVLKREIKNDSVVIMDVKSSNGFQRFVNDTLQILHDTTANKYANAVNSVHYFANLPYGLNDAAVNKIFLGKVRMNESDYYKIEVTFSEEGGGDDFDDVYIYWFNTKTHKPDFLAYEFHVNGGGQRFREAFNERIVGGIRFVDYKNYRPKDTSESIYAIDGLFESNSLELLSEIKLENISVTPGNYN